MEIDPDKLRTTENNHRQSHSTTMPLSLVKIKT